MMRVLFCAALFILVSSLDPIRLEAREGRPHGFVDSNGREFIFHGTNAICKGPPWHPDSSQFSTDISMAKEDFVWMQKMGMNMLRLGVMWPGVEPTRGKYNETYLDEIDKIVTLGAEHGVYTLLDMHQDGISEHFCGEGLPSWAVKLSDGHGILNQRFPAPFDKFNPNTDYYEEPQQNNAKFPTRKACLTHNLGLGWHEVDMETSQAYQALWDNWHGIQDAWAAMWAKVATRFKGRPEVLGLNLINEPFAGDIWRHPLILEPFPSPTNADHKNLQPAYDKINNAVRSVDEVVLLFFAGVTWGDFGAGFTAAPGGSLYANRSVLAFHHYTPPQISADFQMRSHTVQGQRLGTGSFLTETANGPYKIFNRSLYFFPGVPDAADKYLQSWSGWEWKSFFREAPEGPSNISQYGVWGADKTGEGMKWKGSEPDAGWFDATSRTYAPVVAGSYIKMAFDAKSATFELQYDVRSVNPTLATEIYISPARYPGGAIVSAKATSGSVLVHYAGKGQWVRITAGQNLKVGARVTVHISKRHSLIEEIPVVLV